MKQFYNQNKSQIIFYHLLLFLDSLLVGHILFKWNPIYFTIFFIFLFLIIIKIYSINKLIDSSELFKKFSLKNLTGSFAETSFLYNDTRVKNQHGVLLIHGFSASTNEFKKLADELKKENIPYYAPTLTGFGSNDFNLLKSVKPEDWLKDVFEGFEMLSNNCEKISVVGHSMGALLALFLVSEKKLNKIILTSPYIFIKNNHLIIRELITIPILSEFFLLLQPIITKSSSKRKINESYPNKRFVFDAVPTNSLKSLWHLTKSIDFNLLNDNFFHIFFGLKDKTINIDATIKKLKKFNLKFETTFLVNSGHNILEDIEHENVNEKIITIIRD